MTDITKEEFAIGAICLEIIDSIMLNCDFNHEFKRRFSLAHKNASWIFNRAFKDEPMEEFDEYRDIIYKFMEKVIDGKFYLKNEKNDVANK